MLYESSIGSGTTALPTPSMFVEHETYFKNKRISHAYDFLHASAVELDHYLPQYRS